MPLCDALDCVHLHNEGLHRGLLSRRGPFGSSDIAGCIDPHVSFCRLALAEKSSPTFTRYFSSRDLLTFSLSGHRHLLRNVIRAAVRCDCASYS